MEGGIGFGEGRKGARDGGSVDERSQERKPGMVLMGRERGERFFIMERKKILGVCWRADKRLQSGIGSLAERLGRSFRDGVGDSLIH